MTLVYLFNLTKEAENSVLVRTLWLINIVVCINLVTLNEPQMQ